jgi:hypothetical protein
MRNKKAFKFALTLVLTLAVTLTFAPLGAVTVRAADAPIYLTGYIQLARNPSAVTHAARA